MLKWGKDFYKILIIAQASLALFQFYNNNELQKVISGLQGELEGPVREAREALVTHLITYKAYDQNGPLSLLRLGNNQDSKYGDGGYVVPEIAVASADILMGYGVGYDVSFEDDFSNRYNKPSYGFDCSVKGINSKSKLFTFVPECIATGAFTLNSHDSQNISAFEEQLKKLKLEGKKLFIKMDIEGAEYEAFSQILKYASDITGVVIEIHFDDAVAKSGKLTFIKKAVKLLSGLEENFLLLHLHGNNCSSSYFTAPDVKGRIPEVLELTYVNKNLVSRYEVSETQIVPSELDAVNCKRSEEARFEIIVRQNRG